MQELRRNLQMDLENKRCKNLEHKTRLSAEPNFRI